MTGPPPEEFGIHGNPDFPPTFPGFSGPFLALNPSYGSATPLLCGFGELTLLCRTWRPWVKSRTLSILRGLVKKTIFGCSERASGVYGAVNLLFIVICAIIALDK